MKNNLIVSAASLSAFGVAAFVLSARSPVSAESVIGFGSVFALIGMAALEYRVSWKRLFAR